jgi:hypothetical protein
MSSITEGKSKFTRFMGRIRGTDKVIFKTFFSLLGVSYAFLIIYEIVFWNDNYPSIIINLLNALLAVFFITGIIAYIYHNKDHIISLRKIVIWFGIISLSIAIIGTIAIFLLSHQISNFDNFVEPYRSNNQVIYCVLNLFITLFLWIIIIEVVIFFMSFGVTGILTAVIRGIGPETLFFISQISTQIKKGSETGNKGQILRYKFLRWRFNIPIDIDTKHLIVNRVRSHKVFLWGQFLNSNLWALILGGSIGVNISLNGLLMNMLTLEELFSVASFTGAFLLIFIFPCLVYQRMNTRIRYEYSKGSFKLECGLRSRTFHIFCTFAVLSFIYRSIVHDLEPMCILISYLSFLLIFLIISIVTIFVFYNFFEEELAHDIAERYLDIKD